jgi:flavin-dependent dehydrogenase
MAWMNRRTPYGFAIPRSCLDTLILSAAKDCDIPVLQPYRLMRQIEYPNPAFYLQVTNLHDATVKTLETDILIDASGRHGGLNWQGNAQNTDQHQHSEKVGIKAHIRIHGAFPRNDLLMFFFSGGYGGIQPLSANTANLCMLTNHTASRYLKRPLEDLIQGTIGQNPVARDLLQDAVLLEPFLTTANINTQLNDPQAGRFIRVGDAMVTMEPLTGAGMTLALQTGILAAETIAEGIHREWDYAHMQATYLKRYYKKFGWRLRALRWLQPYLYNSSCQEHVFPVIKPLLPLMAQFLR